PRVTIECRIPGAVTSGHEAEGLYRALSEGFAEKVVQRPSFVCTKSVDGHETAQFAQIDRKADHVKCRHAACLSGTIRPSTTLRAPPCSPVRQFRISGMSMMRSTGFPVSGP